MKNWKSTRLNNNNLTQREKKPLLRNKILDGHTEGNKGSKIESLNGVIDDPCRIGKGDGSRRVREDRRRGLNDEPLENNPSVAHIYGCSFLSFPQLSPSLFNSHARVRLFRSDRWYGRVFVSRLAPTIVALPRQNGSTIGSLKEKKKRRERKSEREWLAIER